MTVEFHAQSPQSAQNVAQQQQGEKGLKQTDSQTTNELSTAFQTSSPEDIPPAPHELQHSQPQPPQIMPLGQLTTMITSAQPPTQNLGQLPTSSSSMTPPLGHSLITATHPTTGLLVGQL